MSWFHWRFDRLPRISLRREGISLAPPHRVDRSQHIQICISTKMQAILDERCPGFIGALTAYRESHSDEREFLWLRLIEWIDHNIFESANAEGWRHALGFYSARDPCLDRVREYWLRCDEAWRLQPPTELPSLDDWRQAAGVH